MQTPLKQTSETRPIGAPAPAYDMGLPQGCPKQLETSQDVELANTVAFREMSPVSDGLKQPTTCFFHSP